MQATTISTCKPLSFKFGRWMGGRSNGLIVASSSTRGMNNDREFNGRIVDENMSALRVRIKEMKVQEERKNVASDWMEWEKQYYTLDYCVDVCEATGLLQKYLLNTRPSLVLGIMGLALLSVLISCGMVLFCSIEVVKQIIILGSKIG